MFMTHLSRKRDPEGGSSAPNLGTASVANLAAVFFHQSSRHPQTEARPLVLVAAGEGLEEGLPETFRDSAAVISDQDVNVLAGAGYADMERTAVRQSIDGVRDQVGEDLQELTRICLE